MTKSMSDADCLALARDGHPTGQRALYERYHGASFRLAYLLLGNSLDAEEVVQDAFAYALGNLNLYDPKRGAFWTWLRVILVSRCRNKRRRKRVRRISLDVAEAMGRVPASVDTSTDPVRAFERLDTRRSVWQALERVSPGARDALVLRFYEGLPYREIGDILGCSSAAARSRVMHGKAQLRELLSSPTGSQTPEIGGVCGAEAG